MVQNTPDPPKEESSLSETAEVPVVASTDSEDEVDAEHGGYTMLPQEDEIDDVSYNLLFTNIKISFDRTKTRLILQMRQK